MWTLNAGNHMTKAVPTFQGRVPNSIRVYGRGFGCRVVFLLAYCQVTRRAWYDVDSLHGQVIMTTWDG